MFQPIVVLYILLTLLFLIIGRIKGMMFCSNHQFRTRCDKVIRMLFAKAPAAACAKNSGGGDARNQSPSKSLAALLLPPILACMSILPVHQAWASPKPVPERLPVIMIGDRLVDVAYHLGAVPSAMSVRCSSWPKCKQLQSAVQVLGCPNCLIKKKAKPLINFARTHGINRVIFEKSSIFCLYEPDLDFKKIASLLDGKGLKIEYVDFTEGLESAIQQTAQLLGREENAAKVIADYTKAMEKVQSGLKKQNKKKVLIVNGVYQPSTGKATLRIEAPGGYADKFLLEKLGCVNVGDSFKPADGKARKGHYPVKKKKGGMVLDPLIAADPDVVVMTGDAFAVQKALADYGAANPELLQVTAIRKMAVYAMPSYVDAEVLEYPGILRKWSLVLSK
jgi:hypothetical protein